jgi:hypothetical protein
LALGGGNIIEKDGFSEELSAKKQLFSSQKLYILDSISLKL